MIKPQHDTRCRIQSPAPHSKRYNVPGFRKRLDVLFPNLSHGRMIDLLCKKFKIGHTTAEKWMVGKDIHIYIILIVEMLEYTPRQNWPEHWK